MTTKLKVLIVLYLAIAACIIGAIHYMVLDVNTGERHIQSAEYHKALAECDQDLAENKCATAAAQAVRLQHKQYLLNKDGN